MSEADWQVLIQRRPEKVLRRLPRSLLQRIRDAIRGLAENPRPPGCVKLAGHADLYRLRVGDWRISYAVEEAERRVVILEIAPRGDAYRNL
jgi:mRNA interferase RelE/StbE